MGITVTTCPKLLSFILNCQNMQDLGMEMTAYYSESSPGAWRETVFELKLWNHLVLQEHFPKRTVVEWRKCPLHRRKAKKFPWIPCLAVPRAALWQQANPFTPLFICFPFPLYICLVYWEREIYECLRDLVVQALLLSNLERKVKTPPFGSQAGVAETCTAPAVTSGRAARGDHECVQPHQHSLGRGIHRETQHHGWSLKVNGEWEHRPTWEQSSKCHHRSCNPWFWLWEHSHSQGCSPWHSPSCAFPSGEFCEPQMGPLH